MLMWIGTAEVYYSLSYDYQKPKPPINPARPFQLKESKITPAHLPVQLRGQVSSRSHSAHQVSIGLAWGQKTFSSQAGSRDWLPL